MFFKQLRKRLEPKTIKYYCVGEYGDHWRPISPKGRPHYHALIFYYGNMDRFKLSLLIKELWFYGIAQVLPVLGAQGYVTKYIMKFDKREHLVKPFSLISHGLGISYLSPEMVRYHRRNLQSFATKPGGYKITLPRYYKDKIFGPWAKQVMKVRADLYRRKLLVKQADYEYFCEMFGVNPYHKSIQNYHLKVYKSLNLYKEKRKL